MTDVTKKFNKPALDNAIKGYVKDNILNIGAFDNKYTTVIAVALKDVEWPYITEIDGVKYKFALDNEGILVVTKV